MSKLNENIMNTITDTIQATNQGDDTISADKQTDKLDDSIDKEDTGKIQADDDYKKKFNLE
ncbi:hypothetical protein SDC9_160291 [bioreactor metagenome]|uniref:Uncharacterized protein n=1 Tax=bioreactor metagenome TaxID=1076179 RepID=A0A645FF22_9ZZZZ